MVKTIRKNYKPGSKVTVLWGVEGTRNGTIVEVWGAASSPSHVRVRLAPFTPDEEAPVLLLNPDVVTLTS